LKRRLFNLLTTVSLTLVAACAFGWIRSTYVQDRLRVDTTSGYWWMLFRSGHGSIHIVWDARVLDVRGWTYSSTEIEPHERSRPFGLFQYERFSNSIGVIAFPYWLPGLIGTIIPSLWFLKRRRARFRGSFACPTCGYDIRATPDRCPECGGVPSPNRHEHSHPH
jgi:hypothetical protein